jgi:hypothetical protein
MPLFEQQAQSLDVVKQSQDTSILCTLLRGTVHMRCQAERSAMLLAC